MQQDENEEISGLQFQFHTISSRPEWINVKVKLYKEATPGLRIALTMALCNQFPVIAPSMSHKTLADGCYQIAFVLHDKQAEHFRLKIRQLLQSKQYAKGFGNPN